MGSELITMKLRAIANAGLSRADRRAAMWVAMQPGCKPCGNSGCSSSAGGSGSSSSGSSFVYSKFADTHLQSSSKLEGELEGDSALADDTEAEESSVSSHPEVQKSMVWPFGGEHWCNAEGDHVHIVADLGHLMMGGDYEMSICSLGVMGTRYVRDGEPTLPAEIYLLPGQSTVVALGHIYSEIEIGTKLAIDVRQAHSSSQLVTTVNRDTSTDVKLETTGLQVGDKYEAVLESFNALSGVKSTLKTDRTMVIVKPEIQILDSRSFKITGGQIASK